MPAEVDFHVHNIIGGITGRQSFYFDQRYDPSSPHPVLQFSFSAGFHFNTRRFAAIR